MPLSSVPEAISDFAEGRFVIIVDDEERENEGDLCAAADRISADHIVFMSRQAGGLICIALPAGRLDELEIDPMVGRNTSRYTTAFSVSVEARELVTTGVSAFDRAATVRHLVNPAAKPDDFAKPGHTFPLRAVDGGVLRRAGQTEAVVDLARLAGLYPAGVICEIMKDDGEMARMPDLESFSERHGIKIIAIKDLIAYRRQNEKLVACRLTESVPIRGHDWQAHVYEDIVTGDVHLALVLGVIDPGLPTLVRAHSRCLTGDVFASKRCDCHAQLEAALAIIEREGSGVVVYLGNQEGRGIGLINKLRAYSLQDNGLDTVEANRALDQPTDSREYGIGSQILADVGLGQMRLLTNNPRKLIGIAGYGLSIVDQVPIRTQANRYNERYLRTKKDKLGHLL